MAYKALCPICQLRCVSRVNMDCIECPDHGVITGLQMMQYRGQSQREFAVDVSFDHLHWQVRNAFDCLRAEMRVRLG